MRVALLVNIAWLSLLFAISHDLGLKLVEIGAIWRMAASRQREARNVWPFCASPHPDFAS